jgi:hypothetical protein
VLANEVPDHVFNRDSVAGREVKSGERLVPRVEARIRVDVKV